MIRIELRDAKNHVLMTKDFHGEQILIGRALDCDLIVPDLTVKKHELTLKASELKQLQTTLPLGQHRLRIFNLALYALAEPPRASRWGLDLPAREWRRLALVMTAIFALLMLDQLFLTPTEIEIWKIFESLLAVFIGPLLLAALLSVLSRALHGEYRVVKLYEWTLWSMLGFAVVSQDLYNLRWLLPSLFRYREAYGVFFVIWFALILWSFLALIFEQLSTRVRGLILALVLVPIIAVRSFEFIPSRKKHQMPQPQTSPPRLEILESRPMDTEAFLKTLR